MNNNYKKFIVTAAIVVLGIVGAGADALTYQGRLLRPGLNMQGMDVQTVQQCLLDMGFTLPVYGADGWYGAETYNQITSYQQSEGLRWIDGIVGPETAAALTCEPPQTGGQDDLELTDIDDVDFDENFDEIDIQISVIESNGCREVLEPVLERNENQFNISLKDDELNTNVECDAAETEYEFDVSIDTSDLEEGDYTILVNEEFDYEFTIEEECGSDDEDSDCDEDPVAEESEDETEDNEDNSFSEVGNTTAEVLSSSDSTPSDTAVFSFKMKLTPFDDPIYLPVVAAAAGEIDVIDASTNSETITTQTQSLTSSANRIDGEDGNEYYKVSSEETFTFRSTSKPGAGDYYGELAKVTFTSQDVTDSGFTTFSGVSLGLSDDQWRSDTLSILN